MKTVNRILTGLVLLVAASACNRVAEFTTYPHVCFDAGMASYSIKEDHGSLVLPVSTHNLQGATTVSFEVVPGTAVAGTHYTVEPANGTLSFNGEQTQNITIHIIDNPGVYTGNATFTVNLVTASAPVELSAGKSIKCTVIDNDVPVDWAFVEGEWSAQDFKLSGAKDGDAYKVTIKKVNETTLELVNLWGGNKSLEGTITFHPDNTATVLFAAKQVVYDAAAHGYGDLILLGQNDAGSWAYAPAKATISGEGISIGPWNMLITEGADKGYLWAEGYNTKLSK